jgi:hypothetical protein
MRLRRFAPPSKPTTPASARCSDRSAPAA